MTPVTHPPPSVAHLPHDAPPAVGDTLLLLPVTPPPPLPGKLHLLALPAACGQGVPPAASLCCHPPPVIPVPPISSMAGGASARLSISSATLLFGTPTAPDRGNLRGRWSRDSRSARRVVEMAFEGKD
jgi:hypothetical protein